MLHSHSSNDDNNEPSRCRVYVLRHSAQYMRKTYSATNICIAKLEDVRNMNLYHSILLTSSKLQYFLTFSAPNILTSSSK